MQNIFNICKKIAKSNMSVLILGESGVGKEIIARYIRKKVKKQIFLY